MSCTKCRRVKEACEFGVRQDGKGHKSRCLSCAHLKVDGKYVSKAKPIMTDEERKASRVRYRAKNRVKRAQPAWLSTHDLANIKQIYFMARRLSAEFQKIEVDHIVPLNGKDVCGLHVPWNLQLMDSIENRKKGARHV